MHWRQGNRPALPRSLVNSLDRPQALDCIAERETGFEPDRTDLIRARKSSDMHTWLVRTCTQKPLRSGFQTSRHACSTHDFPHGRTPSQRMLRWTSLCLLGWTTGFEPATTGITIRDSTVELRPPQ